MLLLNRLLGDASQLVLFVEIHDGSHEVINKVDLPIALGGDYFFRLWFYEDGERQISAHLLPPCSEDTYFWHRPFERNEFRDSEHGLVIEFCKELGNLKFCSLTKHVSSSEKAGCPGILIVNTTQVKSGRVCTVIPH
jgi:hypothetical protein